MTARKTGAALLSLLLTLILFLSVSCTPVELDEDTFLPVARELLSRADVLNAIFLEPDGLPVKDGGYENGNYAEVTTTALSQYGFETYGAVLQEVAAVYSESAEDLLTRYAISPDYSAGAGLPARYIVVNDPGNPERNGMLMKYTGEFRRSDEISFDFLTLRVTAVEKNHRTVTAVTVTVKETATLRGDAETLVREEFLPFRFVYENGAWQLDTLVALVAAE
jgi:hypothetical protein